jgi:hypothetical protein
MANEWRKLEPGGPVWADEVNAAIDAAKRLSGVSADGFDVEAVNGGLSLTKTNEMPPILMAQITQADPDENRYGWQELNVNGRWGGSLYFNYATSPTDPPSVFAVGDVVLLYRRDPGATGYVWHAMPVLPALGLQQIEVIDCVEVETQNPVDVIATGTAPTFGGVVVTPNPDGSGWTFRIGSLDLGEY